MPAWGGNGGILRQSVGRKSIGPRGAWSSMSRKAMQALGMAPSICVFELKSVSLHSAFFDVALHASLYAEQDRGGVPHLTR